MLSFIIFTLLTIAFTSGKQVTGVFTSFDSLVWQNGANYPIAGPAFPSWIASLSWKIDGSQMSAGDTFTLDLPCVFKFTTTQTIVNLSVGSINYATCTFEPGDVVVSFSQLQCVLLNTVTSSLNAHGSINFPITFNVGGSALSTDLKDSTCFTAGKNTVSFFDGSNQLSTQATFVGGSSSSDNTNSIVYSNRVVPSLNKQQHYLLGGNCPNGYKSGSIGIKITNSGSSLDCGSIHMAITNQLNDWYMPENANSDFSFTFSCSSTSFVVNYQNIPAGYRPFIDTLVNVANGVSTSDTYVNNYVCVGSIFGTNNGKSVTWGAYDNNFVGGNGEAVEVVTSTWTGSTTQITTIPFVTSKDHTKTIVVEVPVPTITETTTYIGISTSYTTYTAPPGSTASVIEYEPVHTTTTVSTCSFDVEDVFTTTHSTSTWATDTVYVVSGCEISSNEEPATTDDSTADDVSTSDIIATDDNSSGANTESKVSTNEDETSSASTTEQAESGETEETTTENTESSTEDSSSADSITTEEVGTIDNTETTEEVSSTEEWETSSSENITTNDDVEITDDVATTDTSETDAGTATQGTVSTDNSNATDNTDSTADSETPTEDLSTNSTSTDEASTTDNSGSTYIESTTDNSETSEESTNYVDSQITDDASSTDDPSTTDDASTTADASENSQDSDSTEESSTTNHSTDADITITNDDISRDETTSIEIVSIPANVSTNIDSETTDSIESVTSQDNQSTYDNQISTEFPTDPSTTNDVSTFLGNPGSSYDGSSSDDASSTNGGPYSQSSLATLTTNPSNPSTSETSETYSNWDIAPLSSESQSKGSIGISTITLAATDVDDPTFLSVSTYITTKIEARPDDSATTIAGNGSSNNRGNRDSGSESSNGNGSSNNGGSNTGNDSTGSKFSGDNSSADKQDGSGNKHGNDSVDHNSSVDNSSTGHQNGPGNNNSNSLSSHSSSTNNGGSGQGSGNSIDNENGSSQISENSNNGSKQGSENNNANDSNTPIVSQSQGSNNGVNVVTEQTGTNGSNSLPVSTLLVSQYFTYKPIQTVEITNGASKWSVPVLLILLNSLL